MAYGVSITGLKRFLMGLYFKTSVNSALGPAQPGSSPIWGYVRKTCPSREAVFHSHNIRFYADPPRPQVRFLQRKFLLQNVCSKSRNYMFKGFSKEL